MDFDHALREHLPQLHRLARRLSPSAHEAEDLLQDTYTLAWRSWCRDGPPDRLGPWLTTICLNQARSRWRRVRPVVASNEDIAEIVDESTWRRAAGADSSVERAVLERLDTELVHECLARLPYPQREAIGLMDLGGHTAAQVAEMLGVSRNTVLSRVHRGRWALAALILQRVEVTTYD